MLDDKFVIAGNVVAIRDSGISKGVDLIQTLREEESNNIYKNRLVLNDKSILYYGDFNRGEVTPLKLNDVYKWFTDQIISATQQIDSYRTISELSSDIFTLYDVADCTWYLQEGKDTSALKSEKYLEKYKDHEKYFGKDIVDLDQSSSQESLFLQGDSFEEVLEKMESLYMLAKL